MGRVTIIHHRLLRTAILEALAGPCELAAGGAWVPLSDEWYDGAKWSRRETPADPFEEG